MVGLIIDSCTLPYTCVDAVEGFRDKTHFKNDARKRGASSAGHKQ